MNEHGHSAFLVCEDSVPLGVTTERDAVSVLSESFSGKSYDEVLAAEVITSPVHTLREFSMMGEAKNSSFLCRRSLTAGGGICRRRARALPRKAGGGAERRRGAARRTLGAGINPT
jgi:CBS domain-containing protein